MSFRSLGLVPAAALLALGVAHAQPASTGGGGSMAYPDSLKSGQVQIPAPTARDTGNMAYPPSPGGVIERAPTGRDTGNMAYPSGRYGLTGTSTAAAAPMAAPMTRGKMMGTPPMRPDVAPTPAQSAMAQSLDAGPASAPVPYTDFLPPAKPMGKGMMHKPMMHKPMAKKTAAKAAAPAATPAPAAK